MADDQAITVASVKDAGILSDYYLPNGADPGNVISTVILNGTNYERWAKVLRNALHAKNKLNFIDGLLLQRPSPGTDHYKLWGIINSMLVAWILNTIDQELRASVSCSDTAYDLWKSFKERFSVANDPLLYELQSSIGNCKQEGLSVQAYYGKLKRMWDDLEDYDPIPPCCCDNSRCAQQIAHVARRDKERKSQFLMGLDGARFSATRSNILAMSPSPSLSATYSLIQQEEKHHSIARVSEIRPDAVGFSAQVTPSTVSAPALGRSRPFFSCTHCGKTGHEISRCY